MKRLACGDLVSGCAAVVERESADDIVVAAGEHAIEAHGIEATPEFVELVRAAIRDVEHRQSVWNAPDRRIRRDTLVSRRTPPAYLA